MERSFDVIVSDIQMPGMTGCRAPERGTPLRPRRPGDPHDRRAVDRHRHRGRLAGCAHVPGQARGQRSRSQGGRAGNEAAPRRPHQARHPAAARRDRDAGGGPGRSPGELRADSRDDVDGLPADRRLRESEDLRVRGSHALEGALPAAPRSHPGGGRSTGADAGPGPQGTQSLGGGLRAGASRRHALREPAHARPARSRPLRREPPADAPRQARRARDHRAGHHRGGQGRADAGSPAAEVRLPHRPRRPGSRLRRPIELRGSRAGDRQARHVAREGRAPVRRAPPAHRLDDGSLQGDGDARRRRGRRDGRGARLRPRHRVRPAAGVLLLEAGSAVPERVGERRGLCALVLRARAPSQPGLRAPT